MKEEFIEFIEISLQTAITLKEIFFSVPLLKTMVLKMWSLDFLRIPETLSKGSLRSKLFL